MIIATPPVLGFVRSTLEIAARANLRMQTFRPTQSV